MYVNICTRTRAHVQGSCAHDYVNMFKCLPIIVYVALDLSQIMTLYDYVIIRIASRCAHKGTLASQTTTDVFLLHALQLL